MSVLEKEIHGVELGFDSLLKLLGGTPEQRERFWERFKGITTPAEAQLVESSLVAVEHQFNSLRINLQAIHSAAGQIERE
jgi:hypothetical protein